MSEISAHQLEPLFDRLLVLPEPEDEVTKAGIILPEAAREKPQRGTVISAGLGVFQTDGELRPLFVEPGDNVLYTRYGGTEIKLDGEDYLILRESDVIARIGG